MSNPMPPPEFKPSAEKKEEKSGGLSQDDFRKLLATPRAAPGGPGGIKGSFTGGGMRALGMANRSARAPVPQTPRSSDGSGGSQKQNKYKKYSQKNQSKEASAAASKYRDRATERRQGANPDYVETEQILSTLEDAAADVAPGVLYEQSKYLGGDREHTHLVKGLDFALLNKVRQEDTEKGPEAADLDMVFEEVQKTTQEDTKVIPRVEYEKPEMNSAFASNIFKYAIEEPAKKPPKINEMFIPGRTVFIFEVPNTSKSRKSKSKSGIVDDNNPFVVPTTVVRSRADVDQMQTDAGQVGDHEAELKAKKKAAAAAAAKAAALKLRDEETLPVMEPDLEGDDIFADAGREYMVEPVHRDEDTVPENVMDIDGDEQEPMVGPARPDDVDMSQYFDEDSDEDQEEEAEENNMADDATGHEPDNPLDSEAPVLGPARPTDVNMASYFGEESEEESIEGSEQDDFQSIEHSSHGDGEIPGSNLTGLASSEYATPLNEKALPRRKPRLDDIEVDEDADYYSSYGLSMGGRGLAATAYDSDEEDGEGQTILIDKGTHKNKRAQLGRFDFDTEEGFNRYKDTVEVVPKTSFQYGVKMSDGRKTGKWDDGKGKGLTKDEKLDRDWQRISRLMEKNSGSANGGGGQTSKTWHDEGSSGGGGNGGGEHSRNSKRRKNNNW
ncbi:hypothetical protein BG011_006337 [Mortierella polycephala]|uniref:RED-like N-terminal domain-containing protein n=1 Tax=Mortierella polycephala TaxID=41804 RepID=A0A9P6TZQ4_9FUNG|nr:hypothetical protein BG011_006337 [Mortierella polycephala]